MALEACKSGRTSGTPPAGLQARSPGRARVTSSPETGGNPRVPASSRQAGREEQPFLRGVAGYMVLFGPPQGWSWAPPRFGVTSLPSAHCLRLTPCPRCGLGRLAQGRPSPFLRGCEAGACRCLVAVATGKGPLAGTAAPWARVDSLLDCLRPRWAGRQAAGPVVSCALCIGHCAWLHHVTMLVCRSPDAQHLRM